MQGGDMRTMRLMVWPGVSQTGVHPMWWDWRSCLKLPHSVKTHNGFEFDALFLRCVYPGAQTGLPPSVRRSNNTKSARQSGNITDSSVSLILIVPKRYRGHVFSNLVLTFFHIGVCRSNLFFCCVSSASFSGSARWRLSLHDISK